MNTDHQPMYEWNTLPWRAIERSVFKLQKRIYQALQNTGIISREGMRMTSSEWRDFHFASPNDQEMQLGKKTGILLHIGKNVLVEVGICFLLIPRYPFLDKGLHWREQKERRFRYSLSILSICTQHRLYLFPLNMLVSFILEESL